MNNPTDIIHEINRDIWLRNSWVYVKLQSLLETVINKHLKANNVDYTLPKYKSLVSKIEKSMSISTFKAESFKINTL